MILLFFSNTFETSVGTPELSSAFLGVGGLQVSFPIPQSVIHFEILSPPQLATNLNPGAHQYVNLSKLKGEYQDVILYL